MASWARIEVHTSLRQSGGIPHSYAVRMPQTNRKTKMRVRPTRLMLALAILLSALILASQVGAQVPGAPLSGTIKDPTGAVVAKAKITVKNVATAESTQTESDSAGHYSVPNLSPGDYELSVSAEGYSTNVQKVMVASGAGTTADVTLAGVLSLGDLGFAPNQTQGSAQDQAKLDKRSHMLKIHQRVGLIDTAPLIASVILGAGAGGKKTSTSDRWAHMALGSVTGDLYFISAYYAIRAPKIAGTESRGQIRWHKGLAWIHGPGMILTPILGAIAFNQKSNGEKVHGIASAHGPVAIVTAAAYGAAILSVSIKF
jgi:hypothetical protein